MFIERFENLCRLNNTTISTVTKKLGYSLGTLSHWKKGGVPNGNIILQVADYFNVTTDYLLGKSDSMMPSNPNNEKYKELNDLLSAKNGIYLRLAKSAKENDLDLNDDDLNFILEFMKRGQRR